MIGNDVPIPVLEPPWPDDLTITVVTSTAPPGWRGLAHEVAAAAQPGGHSFPLEDDTRGGGHGDPDSSRAAFLYRHAGQVRGYLCLAARTVTGHRELSAGYRQAAAAERVTRPCILVVWVAPGMRRRGAARQLVDAAARHAGTAASALAWAEPFTDSGYRLATSIAPEGMWIADYS
jgi:hypothetical protein